MCLVGEQGTSAQRLKWVMCLAAGDAEVLIAAQKLFSHMVEHLKEGEGGGDDE
jgi:hypothetical protein